VPLLPPQIQLDGATMMNPHFGYRAPQEMTNNLFSTTALKIESPCFVVVGVGCDMHYCSISEDLDSEPLFIDSALLRHSQLLHSVPV
jgi:hypothetical protein